jgi:replicative DNA helicase
MATLASIETPQVSNIEAEAALCGALMNPAARNIVDGIADKLKAEHFAEALHGRIFEAILSLHAQGKAANPITLKPYFDGDEAMKEVGGPSYLVQIMSASGVEVLAARDFADQIRELAQRRNLIDGLRGIIQGAQGQTDVAELVANAEDVLADAADVDHQATQLSAAKAVSRVLDGFQTRERGVSSGIPPIDSGLGPLLPKQLVIVAGRPSMGKSAVASSYGLGAASHGHGVLFISLEMSADELGERIAADFSFDSDVQVPYSAITAGRVTAEQGRQIARSVESLESLPFEIADLASASLSRINSLVRRTARKFKARGKNLELVIVDYLQLVRPDHKGKDRYEDVSEVSRGLKSLAKANGVSVLALTQLSRKVEERADKRPLDVLRRVPGHTWMTSAHPWLKFYPRDWRGDQALRAVSIAARGLWIEMLCVMHEASPYGHLILGGRAVSNDVLARVAGPWRGRVRRIARRARKRGSAQPHAKGSHLLTANG